MHSALHGDLIGHLFPGVAFLIWAALWAGDMLRRGAGHADFMVDARPLTQDAAPLPEPGVLERWMKLLLPVLGMLGEARWMKFPMRDIDISNYQHFTTYTLVSLSGATDMLVRRGMLPRGAGRMVLALTFIVIAFTLGFHGHHMVVAETVHADLAVALLVVGLLVLLEQFRPAPLVRWLQIYALAVSGTWFLHVGWILYVAQYDLMSDDVAVKCHLFFSWHLVGVALALLVTAGIATKGAKSASASNRDT
jgi:hypothetical protein